MPRTFVCSVVRSVALSASRQDEEESKSLAPPLVIHHVALRTSNITNAIDFYSLLGFECECRFRAGPARAAWLHLGSATGKEEDSATVPGCRLEIIEVPPHMLPQRTNVDKAFNYNDNAYDQDYARAPPSRRPPPRALDLLLNQTLLGLNHICLDVSSQVQAMSIETFQPDDTDSSTDNETRTASLLDWLETINSKSVNQFGKALRVGLPPRQQIIGNSVYELAFVYDADGCLVEFLSHVSDLEQNIDDGWKPWDGKGFSGGGDSGLDSMEGGVITGTGAGKLGR